MFFDGCYGGEEWYDRPDEEFAQCWLVKENCKHTAWIPVQFAIVGKVLRIRMDGKLWEDGWVVESVGAVKQEHEVDRIHRQISSLA